MATVLQPVEFLFDEETHTCTKNGIVIPTVTQVLESCGMYDFSMVAPEVLARKALLGKQVHKACHFYDEESGNTPAEVMERWESDLHPEVSARLQGYKKFRLNTGYEPVKNEFRSIANVYGMEYGYQFDSVGYVGKRPWLVDIKNCAAISPAVGLQLAGYELAIPKPLPFLSYERVAVQLFSDGAYKLFSFKDPSDHQVFQACLAVATWKKNKKIA